MMPNKLLGQHFLKNPSVAKNIIRALAPTADDFILEVGPGNGELTSLLAEECQKVGGKILAIEKDAALAEQLKKEKRWENVEIVHGDVLTILPTLPAIHGRKYKIVGNIPYYLTGHLLRIVSELSARPERAVFMVQKEVAERAVAEPPRMNRLAASIQFWAIPKIASIVTKQNFAPQPKIDSAILVLDSRSDKAAVPTDQYYAAVRALFAQPRKTILNNLRAAQKEHEDKEKLVKGLNGLGIKPESRPQNLRVLDITAIAAMFFGDNLMA